MRWLVGIVVAAALLFATAWGYGWSKRAGPHEYARVTAEDVERAKAYLDANMTPLPDGWTWGIFEPEEGVALRVGHVRAKGAGPSKGTVIVVPGYTAPVDLYGDAIRTFHEGGYDVAGFEYRGQGLSARDLDNPEMGFVADWARLGADLAAYVNKLKADGAGDVFVFANSMGGHLALRAAGDAQPDVEAYVLTVPMVKIDTGGFPYEVARAITSFFSATGMDGELTEGQTNWKPDRIEYGKGNTCNTNARTAWTRDALFTLNEPMRVTGTTNGWVRRTMASTDRLMDPAFVTRVDKPVLMFTAGREAFVDTDAAAALCDAMASCERVHYPESAHCITDEKAEVGAEIHAKALAFVNAQAER